ncbi:MAG: pyruvate formate lyase family protein [Candidatus Bathyarchaeia archaeon]
MLERVSLKDVKEKIESLKALARGIPEVSITRAYLMTKSYIETEGEPMPIRRAKALEKVLTEMPIRIRDGELIVGDVSDKLGRSSCIPVEYFSEWLEREIDMLDKREGDTYKISEEDKAILLNEVLPYWKSKTMYSLAMSLMPEYVMKDVENGVYIIGNLKTAISHVSVNYPKVLRLGLNGVKSEIEERLKSCDPTNYKDIERIITYRAMLIAIDAVIKFARRYAELARKMAKEESDIQRKAELEKIAEICEWVPANPARNFHEALQALWFIQCALYTEDYGWVFTLGRVDQYLYPYYKKDIEEGKLTKEQAKLLLELLFIKFNYITLAVEAEHAKYFQGSNMLNIVVVGGETEDGLDGVNELSYLILDADEQVRLIDPEIVVRVSKKILMSG